MNAKGRRKLALFFLIIILTIPLINIFWQSFQKSIWDGQHHLTVAVDNGNLDIWSLEPSEKKIVHVTVPGNTYLSVGSYGEYRAAAVGKLSLLERKNGQLIVDAIEDSFVIPIDGVVVLKEDVKEKLTFENMFGLGGALQVLGAVSMQNVAYSNLSLVDIIRLWFFSFQVNKSSIKNIDLALSTSLSKTTLPDGKEGFTIDNLRFSQEAEEYFNDKGIKDDALTIEILNATTKEGRANMLASLLTTIGGNVVNTAKNDITEKETKIFAKDKSYTAWKIAKLTGGKQVFEAPKRGRADILVILGGK